MGSALCAVPIFPPPLFANPEAFPLAFNDEMQMQAWRTVKRFPKNTPFVFDISIQLHLLGLATTSEWCNQVNQRSLSNIYFETLRNVVAFQVDEPWIDALPSGKQKLEIALMLKVWSLGLPFFVWATVRHIRMKREDVVMRCDFDVLFCRVRESLESVGGYHSWPRGKNLEPVLATLFYCFESCDFNNPWKAWFMDTIQKIIEMLRLKTAEEFQKTLEYFPSTDGFRTASAELWRDLFEGGAAGTPTLTFSEAR